MHQHHLAMPIRICGLRSLAFLTLLAVLDREVVHGQTFVREGQAFGEYVVQVSTAQMSQSLLATAVQLADNKLRIITWQVSNDGEGLVEGGQLIVRKQTFTSSSDLITQVKAIALGSGYLLTAVRTTTGQLKLVTWWISADGAQIQRHYSASGGSVDQISLASLRSLSFTSQGQVVVASRFATYLQVTVWGFDMFGQLWSAGNNTYNGVTQVAATTATVAFSNGPYMATAVRTTGGFLKVITWWVSFSGSSITKVGEALTAASSVIDVNIVNVGNGVCTPVRLSSGALEAKEWSISSAGLPAYSGSGASGTSLRLASTMVALPQKSARLVTASKNSSNRLELITWNLDGAAPVKEGASPWSEYIDEVTIAKVWNYHVVTAVRSSNGFLQLVAWKHVGKGTFNGWLALQAPEKSGDGFRRGDANADGAVNVHDVLDTARLLFNGGKSFSCADAADSNDDNAIDVSDCAFTLLRLFAGGDSPQQLGLKGCAADLGSPLGCDSYSECSE